MPSPDALGTRITRFGSGDVQWSTAGRGIVHSEMFPPLDGDGPSPFELFQIWLNLPAGDTAWRQVGAGLSPAIQ